MQQCIQPLIAPQEPGSRTLRVPVLKVIDGDGFQTRLPISGRNVEIDATIRFGFIDAPEIGQPGGREAKRFLHSLIAGRLVDLVILTKMDTGGSLDRHGRIVAVPYLVPDRAGWSLAEWFKPGRGPEQVRKQAEVARNIELEMVLNGWAWVLDRYRPDECYFEALEEARRQRRGIWASKNNVNPWDFKKQKYRLGSTRREQPRQLSAKPAPMRHGTCPEASCGGHLIQRMSKFGRFLGCSNFPRCRHISKPVNQTTNQTG